MRVFLSWREPSSENLPDGFDLDVSGVGGRSLERWRKFVASQADLQQRVKGAFRRSLDGLADVACPLRFIESSSPIHMS
jgi:hypothetical protein